MAKQSVLVIGGGGREHAICWKLAQSSQVGRIYVAPGNPGIARINNVTLVRLDIKKNEEVGKWCEKEKVNLVVVGPEEYLANGIADELKDRGIDCFGPGAAGAQIEADKRWAKFFMNRHGIPTAGWAAFSHADEAKKFLQKSPTFRVIKASGLAAGKGVVVAKDIEEASGAIDEILTERRFGSAGETLVIEETLEGEEVSVLIFTDGKSAEMMPPTQDHKRLLNGDLGPNTGGMGAYCPARTLREPDIAFIRENVVERTIKAFAKEGIPYLGVLYAGLMLTRDGPRVLEFNCRFGDPETQVVLPLMRSDLFETMMACCRGKLAEHPIEWRDDLYAAGVILASAGYPAKSSKPGVICGADRVETLDHHLVFHSGTALSDDGQLLTNGGRVLMTVRLAPSLELAAAGATSAAYDVLFEGKQFRTDIAHRGIAAAILHSGRTSYKNSGVDIEAGDCLVSRIRPAVATTKRPGLMGGIGGFGGLFDVAAAGYSNESVLVSGTDGVGTKLKIAIECGIHETVGIDLVAMCVNDVLAHGAEPLFFLDYFACGRLDVDVAAMVISGVAEGCRRAGCALVGGETAEMPDMYADGEYDLAGFAVGAVERDQLLPQKIQPNDLVIGLPSSGIHSNGFSLVRRVLKIAGKKFQDAAPFHHGKTIGEALLEPTRIYARGVLPAMRANLVNAFAHVTGGGLTENVPRILPDGTRAVIDATKWDIPTVFGWLATVGGIGRSEMLRTFNCGIGAILVCSPENEERLLTDIKAHGERPVVIGRIEEHPGKPTVKIQHFEEALEKRMCVHIAPLVKSLSQRPKSVGVLVSGSGTNLQALINACQDPTRRIGAEIVVVVSNKPNVEGLARAERAGIRNIVIKHTDYPSREAFDDAVTQRLEDAGVEIVCLAGFMRILSEKFVRRWRGALLNVHPSLLPSFKGAHAHEDVLRAGVRVTGCTVHFVEVEIDSGAIIEQEAVPVLPGDTVERLQERVKVAEHRAFPRALKLLANGRIKLDSNGTLIWR